MRLQIYFDNHERYFPKDLNDFASFSNAQPQPEKAPETLTINYYRRPLGNGKTWIYYILFYMQDDGLGYFHIDNHKLDWEVVVAEMDDEKDSLLRLCYTPHGRKEHFWLSEEDTRTLLKRTGNAIPIYCSKGKHATYPVNGIIWRYGGFANDTNNCCIVYNPQLKQLSSEAIASPYFSPKSGILLDNLNYPTVRLAQVSTRMLFKNPC